MKRTRLGPAGDWQAMVHDLPTASVEVVVFMAVLGLVMGSFLGTVALRVPAGQSIGFGRSHCESCGKTLRPWQLIPLIGWISQGGRCHDCKAPISPFYLVMELGGAAVCLWSLAVVPQPLLLPSVVLGWVLLTLGVMDWRTLVLSDALTLPLLALGFVIAWFYLPQSLVDHIWGALGGAALLFGLNELYRLVRHQDGLGLGDVKLAGAAGAWLGWQALPSVFVIASTTALVVLLVHRGFGSMIDWKVKVAFGSYLCLGVWIVWLYGPIAWG